MNLWRAHVSQFLLETAYLILDRYCDLSEGARSGLAISRWWISAPVSDPVRLYAGHCGDWTEAKPPAAERL